MSFKHLLVGTFLVGTVGYGLPSYAITDTPQKEQTETPAQPQKPQYSLTKLKQEFGELNQQDLTAITKDIIATYGNTLTEEQLKAYIEVQVRLIDRLRNFKVTGIGVTMAVDPNFAFIYDNQNPEFVIYFKNPAGEVKQRRYQASIKSLGLKIECAVNLHLILFINTDLNYFDANTTIPLSWGGEVSKSLPQCSLADMTPPEAKTPQVRLTGLQTIATTPEGAPCVDNFMNPGIQTITGWHIDLHTEANSRRPPQPKIASLIKMFSDKNMLVDFITGFISPAALSLTYASIKNNGGMLMATLGFGLKCNVASVVTGGSLKPVEKPATSKLLNK